MTQALLTARELAAVLKYTEGSVYQLASTRPHSLPPSMKLGRSLRWHPDVVDTWLREKAGILTPTFPISQPQPVNRKRGRPTKGEASARAALKTAGGAK